MKRLIYLLVFLGIALPAYAQVGLYQEDRASADKDPGNACYAVRDDHLAGAGATSADGDYIPIRTSYWGALWTTTRIVGDEIALGASHRTVQYAAITTDGADSDEIVAAISGYKIRVLGYAVYCSGAVAITFEDEDGTDVTGAINLVANGNLGIVVPNSPFGYFQTGTATKALHLLKSAAVNCDGHITYIQVS